jgi:hypothetical protein
VGASREGELSGPVDGAWLHELRDLEIELLNYQPENCYLSRAPLTALQAARDLPFVQMVTLLTEELKPRPDRLNESDTVVLIVALAAHGEVDVLLAELRRS